MSVTLLGITWAHPEYVFMLPLCFIASVALVYGLLGLKKIVRLLASTQHYKLMLPGYSASKYSFKTVFFIIALTSVSLALLRPQWGTTERVVEQEGRELFIALDISGSMLASDVKPTRLAFAKAKIKQLLKMLPAERVGLIVFSGGAFVQCPLTRDMAAFNLFLDTVDVETLSSGTTSIAQALHTTLEAFASLPTRKNKVVVLFTDGEDFSDGLGSIKEEAQKMGLSIVTYGVGTIDGAPVPIMTQDGTLQGYHKDEQGKVVISRLNEGILQALARDSGGIYISPTQSNSDLQTLVAKIQSYEKEKFEDKKIETGKDRYYIFTGIGFLLLLVEWLL